MPFWSTNFGEDAALKDPKRKYRFTVEFQGIDAAQGGALLWYAKSAAKPSFAIGEVEHAYLNHRFYYPGSVTWEPISIVMVDPVDPDMTATFSDIVVKSGYSPPTDANSLGSISKAKAAASLGTVIITQIDSDGNPLETLTLWNPFIEDIKYGDSLSYEDATFTEVSVTLRYDWARIETTNDSKAVSSGGREFFKV